MYTSVEKELCLAGALRMGMSPSAVGKKAFLEMFSVRSGHAAAGKPISKFGSEFWDGWHRETEFSF